MDTPTNAMEDLFEKLDAYLKTSYELAKLKALETLTVVITSLISKLSVMLMLCLFLLIFNVGIALWIGELLGKSYYGFFIVALFYCIAAIIFHFFLHKWIKKPLSDLIIYHALNN